jgi:hypothetical protein
MSMIRKVGTGFPAEIMLHQEVSGLLGFAGRRWK